MKEGKQPGIISKSEMVLIKDAITGQMERAKVTITVKKDKAKCSDKFTLLFQAVNAVIVKHTKPVTCKMLLYLLTVVRYDNRVDRTIAEICEDLEYKRSQVSQSLRELEDSKIIMRIEHPDDKRKFIIILNPLQSWKGDIGLRAKMIQSAPKNQLQINFGNNINAIPNANINTNKDICLMNE